jgi:predicted Zn-dependent protease
VEVEELQLQVNTLRIEALAAHLRCISRDPDHARGYESLARHYAMQREPERARRSAELATRLAGARQANSMLGVLRAAEEKEKR